MTVALIDADIVCFRCAASCEKKEKGELVSLEPLDIAIQRADNLMGEILAATEAVEYKSFISGSNNFRYEVNPMYKANRVQIDPVHRQSVKEFLISEWNSVVTDGYEADDALGINQTDDTIICSIDKDLLMIPGKHYNFVKREFTHVSPIEGLKAFYRQMLIGDSSDNVIGVEGIGPVKAGKLIDSLIYESQMVDLVMRKYDNDSRFVMNANCLYIWRKEYERFTDRPFVKEMQNLWH